MRRHAFCETTGIGKETLIKVEQGKTAPSGKVLKQLTNTFPQYTLWLMNDQVIEEAGQISPEIEQARKTLKQIGTDTD